ncbi:FAD-dependent oxidoreductase [Actinomycetospora sp. NBRC 106375]|uniref:FAD-dependent monooxygenase n=1 Tax=Actinomycetospora sp. NBRC 106375 TaxID=3032207 RepID=UPI0024A3B666|nr:FAD-dependent monooxygenase [Actinomycetospora sp. NBRC 106375]GLZ48324.1 FAD-dependent oxidoreductase [Actinomycetospora sp. NBRC 106375]
MAPPALDILVSGASVAGPVTAYWLRRAGHRVTVVERSPRSRTSGGHAVDLFSPAIDVVERMGVLDAIRDHATGTERMTIRRESARREVTVDMRRLMSAVARRHVEIMRDDLSRILCAACDDIEWIFDDSITAVADDGGVTFERSAPRRFDVVVGADGLHSGVRRIVFGPDSGTTRWLGGHIAVAVIPADRQIPGHMTTVLGVRRMVGVYGARHTDDARAFFLFRPDTELRYDHRDVPRQKQLLRDAFSDVGGEVPGLLDEVDRSATFYFDAITQLVLDRWTRGRVALVGDAAYCPGPAVGGSTSLAVVGAHTLAGEIAQAAGDTSVAFPAYEDAMRDYVVRSRAFAQKMATRLVPGSRLGGWALATGAATVARLPTALGRRLVSMGSGDLGLHESVALRDYPALRATAT